VALKWARFFGKIGFSGSPEARGSQRSLRFRAQMARDFR